MNEGRRSTGITLWRRKINSTNLYLSPPSPQRQAEIAVTLPASFTMIAFADLSKYNQHALRAASLSILPGLGQLYNRRLDKAIAFFLVDIANLALLASILGVQLPVHNYATDVLMGHLSTWRPGTFPFFLVQSMLLGYVFFSMYDAYKDALSNTTSISFRVLRGVLVSLSISTCVSYFLHMLAIFALGFTIILNVKPELAIEDHPQITLDFELVTPDDSLTLQNQKSGKESDTDNDAHGPEKPKNNEIQPSLKSAQMTASSETDSPSMNIAATESAALASQEIKNDSPERAVEVKSDGAVPDTAETTPEKSETTKITDSPSTEIKFESDSITKPKLIAQLPVLNPQVSPPNVETAASSDNKQSNAPQMLGFIDSTISEDAGMRLLWSDLSSNIRKYVNENPLQGQGMAVASFMLDKNGTPVSLQSAPQTELANSLTNALQKMPHVVPPKNKENQTYLQVKVSNESNGTFVSVEVNSRPSVASEESLNDFRYETDLQAYLQSIKKSVYASWRPPVQEGVKPVMIGFKVTTNGRVVNQHIVQSSGDPKLDRAALNAAQSVSNWTQPPAGTSEDLDVCMVLQKCKTCDNELSKKASSADATARTGPYAGLNVSD